MASYVNQQTLPARLCKYSSAMQDAGGPSVESDAAADAGLKPRKGSFFRKKRSVPAKGTKEAEPPPDFVDRYMSPAVNAAAGLDVSPGCVRTAQPAGKPRRERAT